MLDEIKIRKIEHKYDRGKLFTFKILSFMFRCETEEQLAREDVLADKWAQCFVGSQSTWENLKLIPADRRPKLNRLKESDRAFIMEGLDPVLPAAWQDKIWDMIWKRWNAYEDFCNQR